MDLVAALEEFMVRCAEEENTETPIACKLVTIYIYHEHFVRLSVLLGSPMIKWAKQGIKKTHVEKGTHRQRHDHCRGGILARMQDNVPPSGAGGRVVSVGLTLSSVLMWGASEPFVGQKGEFDRGVLLAEEGNCVFPKQRVVEGRQGVGGGQGRGEVLWTQRRPRNKGAVLL